MICKRSKTVQSSVGLLLTQGKSFTTVQFNKERKGTALYLIYFISILMKAALMTVRHNYVEAILCSELTGKYFCVREIVS